MSKSRFPILLYRTHAWVGLLSGLFLIVICVTGSIAVFRPEIERAVDYRGVDFTVVPTDGEKISAGRAAATAQAAYPGSAPLNIRFPAPPGSTQVHGDAYLVTLAQQGRGKRNVQVLVDPYRNAVIREHRNVRGWGDWLRQLHVRFLYGSFWGRYIVGFFGLTLVFSTVTGLMIFARFNGGSWRPRRVRWGRGTRIVSADLHKLVGLGTVAFNIIFGVTGAVLGLEGIYHKFIAEKQPVIRRATVAQLPEGGVDAFIDKARALVPDAQPNAIQLNHARAGIVRVDLWPTTRHLVREASSYVIFDAMSSEPIEVYDATKAAAGVRLYYAMEPLHFGRLGGAMWVKLLWGLMGLSGGFLSITGFVIYVLRKRKPKRVHAQTAEPAEAKASLEFC
jgi:uncharacterized iron-regulated membrane protein